jgi:hypothetical protein
VVDKPATDAAPKQKSSRNAGQRRFTADFSDAELARLIKCVCCGISWTTRKGVTQKMVHIQSCAKKNAFTDDTVKILVRREVDKALAENQTAKAKGKGKAIDPENLLPEVPRTYMEDVVQGAEPKRKMHRSEPKTVKKATETREVILDKARVILGNHVLPNTQDVSRHPFQTQGFGPSRLVDQLGSDAGNWKEPPPTQAFAESALRQRQAVNVMFGGANRKQSVFDAEAIGYEEASMPPSTQNFGPSKLAGLHSTSSSSAFSMQHNIDSDHSSPHSQTILSLDSSLNPRSPRLVRTFLGNT